MRDNSLETVQEYQPGENAALDRLREANAEAQKMDETGAWLSASAFSKDMGADQYEVVVWARGTALNHFYMTLDQNGETREYIHWLKSRGGKRFTREALASDGFTETSIRYNTLSGDIQPANG